MTKRWQDIKISTDHKYHLYNNKPCYAHKYIQVQAFHEPGLSAVLDETGAYHIDLNGLQAYKRRFIKSFGFYDMLAAVEELDGFFHVNCKGEPQYKERYSWCGNFQEKCCVVKDLKGGYFHIDLSGNRLYKQSYRYVGDYKYGYAVVCNENGLHTHIDLRGNALHDHWFKDLDVYHKGYARAEDDKGWMHVDLTGNAIYSKRFRAVEPFYNNLARVVTNDGAIVIISTSGEIINTIRKSLIDPVSTLSGKLVGFWSTEIIATAIKSKVLDHLPEKIEIISKKIHYPERQLLRLLNALWEMNLVFYEDRIWKITELGRLLVPTQGSFLSSASIMWSDVNNNKWKVLDQLLLQDDVPWHDSIKELANIEQLQNYYSALYGYSKLEIDRISTNINFLQHKSILLPGLSSIPLANRLMDVHADLTILLSEKQKEIELNSDSRVKILRTDFFKPWDICVNAICFMKFLHYWDDGNVCKILDKASDSLEKQGTIYIIEMLLDQNYPDGGMLDLNMLAETGGKLRFMQEWKDLLDSCGYKLKEVKKISTLSVIMARINE